MHEETAASLRSSRNPIDMLPSERRIHPSREHPLVRRIRRAVAIAATSLLVGCSSLYSRSLDHGDEMAALGRWDEAASLYERAARLEPDEPEARNKLGNARKHQAHDRVVLGRSLLSSGRPREALRPLTRAVHLDPESAEAKATLAEARSTVVGQAQKELDAGNTRQALLVAREVLTLLPGDLEARRIEDAARTPSPEHCRAIGGALARAS